MPPVGLLQVLHTFAGPCGNVFTSPFFRFPTWYEYLKLGNDSAGNCAPQFIIPDGIPLVALAIVDIMLRIAAIVAIVFVVYGGFKYTTSQGEPQATANARSTIIGALVGLSIATIAAAIVSFIGIKLAGA